MNGRMNGRTNGRANGQKNGRVNGRTNEHSAISLLELLIAAKNKSLKRKTVFNITRFGSEDTGKEMDKKKMVFYE